MLLFSLKVEVVFQRQLYRENLPQNSKEYYKSATVVLVQTVELQCVLHTLFFVLNLFTAAGEPHDLGDISLVDRPSRQQEAGGQ